MNVILTTWLNFLLPLHTAAGGVTELAAIVTPPGRKHGDVWRGYFSAEDVDAAVAQVVGFAPPTGAAVNFYFGLHPASLPRSPSLDRAPESGPGRMLTSDCVGITFLAIDVDPVRPAKTSSTDAELDAAEGVAQQIFEWATSIGAPAPWVAMSGNGIHLVWPVPVSRDVGHQSQRMKALLTALSTVFDTPSAKIDRSVYQPNQLLKLYGTTARKGQATAIRPHRVSSITFEPYAPTQDVVGILLAGLGEQADPLRPLSTPGADPLRPLSTPGADALRPLSTPGADPLRPLSTPGADPLRPLSTPGADPLRPLFTPGDEVWVNVIGFQRLTGLASSKARAAISDAWAGKPWKGIPLRVSQVWTGEKMSWEVALSSLPPEMQRQWVLLTAPELTSEDVTAAWSTWRARAIPRLPIEQVYAPWWVGRPSGPSWWSVRDPKSPTGDESPSAGVADGTGAAERGAFHSFRDGRTISVFDFLVEVGAVADFNQARAIVADVSGVPMPDLVAIRRAKMTSMPLADGVKRVHPEDNTAGPSVDDSHPGEVVTRQDMAPVMDVVTQIPSIETPSPETSSPESMEWPKDYGPEPTRPYVTWVAGTEEEGRFYERLADAIAPYFRIYSYRDTIVAIRPGKGMVDVTYRNVGGVINSMLEIRAQKWRKGELVFDKYRLLTGDHAAAFLASPAVRARLPQLRSYSKAPMFDRAWNVIPPGFHPETGIYYDGPAITPRLNVTLLPKVMADFCWKADADMCNFVGCLITMVGMPHWWDGNHPFLAINGNKPGVGKTEVAQLLATITQGAPAEPLTVPEDEAEMEKRLAGAVSDSRVILFDNIRRRGGLSSASLEMMITAPKPRFRRLGTNEFITSGQNDFMVILTANLTQLDEDLRRRSLPVRLHHDGPIKQRKFSIPRLTEWVRQHRIDLISEVMGMVMAWVDAGQPASAQTVEYGDFQHWATTVGSILSSWGFGSFLGNVDASNEEFDARYQHLKDIAETFRGRKGTAEEWETLLLEARLTDVWGRRWKDMTPRSRQVQLGKVFSMYVGRAFDVASPVGIIVVVLVKIQSASWDRPIYSFETQEA